MATKLNYLDGLRGWAAAIVLLDHWMLMGYNDPTSQSQSVLWESWLFRTPLRLFIDGGFAVSIFFVLSGYVLMIKYMKNQGRTDLITSGLIKRYPRLMFPAFVSLILYYSWLHFGPWQGFSGCHAVGELSNNRSSHLRETIQYLLLLEMF